MIPSQTLMNRPWNSGNSGVPIDDHGHSQNRKPSPGGEPRDMTIGTAQNSSLKMLRMR